MTAAEGHFRPAAPPTVTVCKVGNEVDLLSVRQLLRERAKQMGLGLVDQTKLITAGSELARNILRYAGTGGGQMEVEIARAGRQQGLRVTFSDKGPGIPDLALAMKDGYSSAGSLGLGLPGAKRLVDEFQIASVAGEGTTVTIVKWNR